MKQKNGGQGFTLVEVMIVMAIIIILAAFAVPAVREALPNYRLRSLSYDILASLQRAKGLAVQNNQNMDVCFFADRFEIQPDLTSGDCNETPIASNNYSNYGNSMLGFPGVVVKQCGAATVDWDGNVPSQSSITNSNATAISFSPRGTASSDSIFFENGEAVADNNICYGITTINTGAVKIRKYVPCTANNKTCWIE